jgi:hypothetical protein
MVGSTLLAPPMPVDPLDQARWDHTRLRRRMLYGEWLDDLAVRITARVGAVRREAWGAPDMSANPFRAISEQTACLYDETPVISHPDDPSGRAAGLLAEQLEQAGLWSIMAGVQRDCIGMREMLVRVDVEEDTGILLPRPVYPDLVAEGPHAAADPNQLGSIREARLRKSAEGLPFWTTEILDPATETYQVVTPTGDDVSRDMLGAASSGAAYMYRLQDGRAILPYSLYHAKLRGRLWDSFEAREIVEGTLDVGVLWTFWHHCVRAASWPQRYAAGYRVAGSVTHTRDGTARTEAVMDPAVLAILVPDGDLQGAGLVGQWGPAVEPDVLAQAILSYERRMPSYMGHNPADFARTSGDPRSGYALMISRDGQREAARKLEPQFRRGDVRLLTLCAAARNRWCELHGVADRLPELGWRIRYQAIPPSPEELQARRENVLALRTAGLMSRNSAYREINPGVSVEEARRALDEIDAEIGARQTRPAPKPPPPDDDDGAEDDDDSGDDGDGDEDPEPVGGGASARQTR